MTLINFKINTWSKILLMILYSPKANFAAKSILNQFQLFFFYFGNVNCSLSLSVNGQLCMSQSCVFMIEIGAGAKSNDICLNAKFSSSIPLTEKKVLLQILKIGSYLAPKSFGYLNRKTSVLGMNRTFFLSRNTSDDVIHGVNHMTSKELH